MQTHKATQEGCCSPLSTAKTTTKTKQSNPPRGSNFPRCSLQPDSSQQIVVFWRQRRKMWSSPFVSSPVGSSPLSVALLRASARLIGAAAAAAVAQLLMRASPWIVGGAARPCAVFFLFQTSENTRKDPPTRSAPRWQPRRRPLTGGETRRRMDTCLSVSPQARGVCDVMSGRRWAARAGRQESCRTAGSDCAAKKCPSWQAVWSDRGTHRGGSACPLTYLMFTLIERLVAPIPPLVYGICVSLNPPKCPSCCLSTPLVTQMLLSWLDSWPK